MNNVNDLFGRWFFYQILELMAWLLLPTFTTDKGDFYRRDDHPPITNINLTNKKRQQYQMHIFKDNHIYLVNFNMQKHNLVDTFSFFDIPPLILQINLCDITQMLVLH